MTDGQAEAERLRALRELLPATGAGIYLDTATLGPLPAETAEAMRQADDWELRVGRVSVGRAEDAAQRAEEARAVIAALIGAQPAQVLLAHGRADAMRLAAEILGGPIELHEPVSPVSGAPRAAGREEAGRPRVVDLSYLAGAAPVAVDELDADGAVLAADRWLLGPEGTAALWLRRPTAGAISRTLPRSALVGLARSVGWLEMYVGLEWIHQRTARLAARLQAALSAVANVDVVTPAPPPAAIVSFRLLAWPPTEAAAELGRRVFALLAVLPEHDLLRASVAWFNTEDEIDRLAGVVATLAEHTPASLPRRPPLGVQ